MTAENLARLKPIDRLFVDAVANGVSAQAFAREHHYSVSWAQWKSKQIRERLGVQTMGEVIRSVSEMTADERAEARQLIRELREAKAELEKAKTPAAKEEAREDIRDAEADLRKLAAASGVSVEDLKKLQAEKRYAENKDFQSRYESEREAERLAAEAETDDDEEETVKPPPAARAKKDKPPPEVPPESAHWADKPLFGRKAS
jgi:uncharacterized protein YdiU (UPF0061 family)